ncbi:MAG: carboxymuconolactone decarboxylase family protein [Haloferacaceae archaeon]
MTTSEQELDQFQRHMQQLTDEAPEINEFLEYVEAAEAPGELDAKYKELISLAIGIVSHCEPCILWHTNGALEAGATREEVLGALKIAVVMGGGPGLAYAVKAHQVLDDLESVR